MAAAFVASYREFFHVFSRWSGPSTAAEHNNNEILYDGGRKFFENASGFVQYPEGMVNYRYYIIKEVLPDYAIPDTYLDVIVGAVDSSQSFWVILLGEAYLENLVKLTNAMQAASMWLPMSSKALLPGQFCVGLIDGVWRRVRIAYVDAKANNATLVSLVDWGGHRTVSCDDLRWLPLKFAELPQQALHARLLDCTNELEMVAGQKHTFKLIDYKFQTGELVLQPVPNQISNFPSPPLIHSCLKQEVEDSQWSGSSTPAQHKDDETINEGGRLVFENYPDGVVNYDFHIIKEVLPDCVIPGTNVDVIMGAVDSPQSFWVILLGEAYLEKLVKLTNEMQATSAFLPMSREALLPGQFCAGLIDGAWRRVRIVHVDASANNATLVSLVDWGGHRTVSCDDLQWLPLKFANLPQQALHARLLHCTEDLQLVAGQKLTFRLVNYEYKKEELVLQPVANLISKFPSPPLLLSDIKHKAEDSSGDGRKNDTFINKCCKMFRTDLGLHVFCKDNSWMLSLEEVTELYIGHLHSHVVGAIAEAFIPGFRLHFEYIQRFKPKHMDLAIQSQCMLEKKYNRVLVRVQDMPDLLRAVNVHDLDKIDWNKVIGEN